LYRAKSMARWIKLPKYHKWTDIRKQRNLLTVLNTNKSKYKCLILLSSISRLYWYVSQRWGNPTCYKRCTVCWRGFTRSWGPLRLHIRHGSMPTEPARATGRGQITIWGPNVYDRSFLYGAQTDVNTNCQTNFTVNIQPKPLLELLTILN